MKVALTYNIKKETETAEGLMATVSQESYSGSRVSKYIDKNLIKNYPERIDDTFAEWDSDETILAVQDALTSGGHNVTMIEADNDAYSKLKEIKPEFVFNVAEGFYGASRESQIPSMLEMLNIPFTGSDSVTIGICHDKSRCKEILIIL